MVAGDNKSARHEAGEQRGGDQLLRWKPMLEYLRSLHAASTYPAVGPLEHPFESPGRGYFGSPCFAHWDSVHVALDAFADGAVEHGVNQLRNILSLQQSDGFIPGLVYFRESVTWIPDSTWPPVWPAAVDAYMKLNQPGMESFLAQAFDVACRQIDWFDTARAAQPDGYFYRDILDREWESGVDEGVRFDNTERGRKTCIDATAHVWMLCDAVVRWGEILGHETSSYRRKRDKLETFIRSNLFDPGTGFFYDIWSAGGEERKVGAFEGMWPVVVGAAASDQAHRVIDEHLLNPQRFFTTHPISTVAADDERFERRMWRGPTWNSMSYWAAVGCIRYGRTAAAREILEDALTGSAIQFERTGTIWEFYDQSGGPPENLARKPDTANKIPCRDYTGHNPLIAMARLWERTGG